MNKPFQLAKAFTLIELLVVIAVMAILAALLLQPISVARAKAQRADCMNNIKQVNLGLRLYCDDDSGALPRTPGTNYISPELIPWTGYKSLMKGYVGLSGSSSPQDKVFTCPADTFYYKIGNYVKTTYVTQGMHEQEMSDYTSFFFNGGNLYPYFPNPLTGGAWLGIAGQKLNSIKDPVKTVLVAEASAYLPFSWHQSAPRTPTGPKPPMFNDAENTVSFVDGHVSYIKIYWNGRKAMAIHSDPPGGYDYKWSGN
jgi:prepilin-type N-terminal cleavage/methylation domain-containing protein